MSTDEDYGPCHACGQLTDSFVCSDGCARQLDAEKAEKEREADEELHGDLLSAFNNHAITPALFKRVMMALEEWLELKYDN